jgi:uncharacterized phage infection (PIP) family protein YhgE
MAASPSMSEQEIQLLKDQVAKLSRDMANVDFWRRVAKATGITFVALVTATVATIAYLGSVTDEAKRTDEKVTNDVGQVEQRVAGLEDRVKKLSPRVDALEDNAARIAANSEDAIFQSRVKRLAERTTAYNKWDDFTSDLQELDSLGEEYLFLIVENPSWDTDSSANKALQEAAGSVEKKATAGLPGLETEKDPDQRQRNLKAHLAAAPSFQGILKHIATNRKHLDSDYLMCYQAAFPTWLGNAGVFWKQDVSRNAGASKSGYCQSVVGLIDKS